MKTEFVEVTQTLKRLAIELPSDVVDAEIARVTAALGRRAKIPGFRPGKVPTSIVWQRFKDDILREVAHELVPGAIDQALRERDLEPVAVPEVTDVVVNAGQPLSFTATFETVPSFDPGEYRGIGLRKKAAVVEEGAIDEALERLRQRAARFEPIEGRALALHDWASVDLARQVPAGASGKPGREKHDNVTIEIGAPANPPGFDDELTGLEVGAQKTFVIHFPADHAAKELAGTEVEYTVALKSIKERVVPALDDDFAKDLGSFETLADLRERVRHDLQHEADHDSDREVRSDLLGDLAKRVPFDVPVALVDQELDRRLEEFVRRLVDQKIDPNKTGIDWQEFRNGQRESAIDAVKATIALDEVARRETVAVSDEDLDQEVQRYADSSGRSAAAVRAHLEKDGGLGRLRGGLRREKTVEFLLANASITTV
ncbi:MAG: trigger factor [Acidobacteria bacterium]|nr:trigger factor [Acidobacteriota bacterium]